MKPKVQIYAGPGTLSLAAARLVARCAATAVRDRGRFVWMISGGATPLAMFDRLASPSAPDVPWRQTEIYWADERAVPADDVLSNFNSAHAHLLSKVPVAPTSVHRIKAEQGAAAASEDYRRELVTLAQAQGRGQSQPPVFDLILLGVGRDGHTASLFPSAAALDEDDWVLSVKAPAGVVPQQRVSIGLSVLNNARCVAFLVAGADKHAVVRSIVLDPVQSAQNLPAARAHGGEKTIWLIDRASGGAATGSSFGCCR